MLSPTGTIQKRAVPLASGRQRLGSGLRWVWRDVVFHLKGSPRRNRYFFWFVGVWLMALHLTHLMAKSDDAPIVWGPPVEPPGSVIVTSASTHPNTDGMPHQDRADVLAEVQSGPVVSADAKAEAANGQLWPSGLRASLQQWSEAWRRQDVPAYLDMYAPDFAPSSGVSRQAWEQSRTRRIKEKSNIHHEMRDLSLQMTGSTAIVKFTQIYQDERISANDPKIMHWVHRDGLWLIAHEKTQ